MRRHLRVPYRVAVTAAAAVASLAVALPASAHTPVHLDSHDVLPWRGPLILDGENPVMFFGDLTHPGAIRSAQIHMAAGQTVIVSLVVPDEAPENALAPGRLPVILVIAPDRTVTRITATTRVSITTDTGLKMLILHTYTTKAMAGDYSVIAVGRTPVRFVISTGVEGEPFAGLTRGTVASGAEVTQWYDTPVPTGCHRASGLDRAS